MIAILLCEQAGQLSVCLCRCRFEKGNQFVLTSMASEVAATERKIALWEFCASTLGSMDLAGASTPQQRALAGVACCSWHLSG